MPVNNSVTMNLALNYLHKVFIRPFPHIKLTPVTTKEISEIIKSLKWKNSHGYDDIPVRILKISLPFIISPLTYISNKSLCTGIFPTRLKYSQLNPILKKAVRQTYQTIDQFHYSHLFQKSLKKLFIKD